MSQIKYVAQLLAIVVIIIVTTICRCHILRLCRTSFLASRCARRFHRRRRRLLRAAFRRTWDSDGFFGYAFRVRAACCARLHAEISIGYGAGNGGTVGLRRGRDGLGCDVGCSGWCAGVLVVALEDLRGGMG